jgi:anthranilate/para-aminobenzoate synthase component I
VALRVLFNGNGWIEEKPFFLESEESILRADAPEQLPRLLAALDEVIESGDPDLFAAGFISYEAGVFLEGSTSLVREHESLPFAEFGVFRRESAARSAPPFPESRFTFEETATAEQSLSSNGWKRGVESIRDGIARGDVYQVNLTRRTRYAASGDPFALARALYDDNPVPYAITLAGEGWSLVSNSPELFLDVDLRRGAAQSAPIKGTVARGADGGEARLLSSRKDAAEHLMIVDLIRNDLGRVAVPGGVSVPAFRTVKTFRHLHHLESTVSARLRRGTRLSDVLAATLPGGSITGAPKRAALRFIHELEPCARGPYTGAAGFVAGDGRAVFNVAIRTAVLSGSKVDYHAGGGIVWDSDWATEWEETEIKSREIAAALAAVNEAPR